MQDTLNFPTTPSTSTTRQPPLLPPSKLNFPSNPRKFPPQKNPHNLPSLSSKSTTTTTFHPTKPSSNPKNVILTKTPEFHEKTLFLDSIFLHDSLSQLPPSSIANSSSLSDLKSLTDYLFSLGFTPPQLRRIVTMCPDILSLRLHDTASVFAFLLREANVKASHLPRVLCRRPRLLLSDVSTRLRPTMYFLQSIGIHEVHKHTDLLTASVEDKFIPKIHFFERVGFTPLESVSMFRDFPALFCYSVEHNFEPKFNYFVVEMGREVKELKEFPHYFSFSLEKRIKPRHQRCLESGVYLPLPLMLKLKDGEFVRRLDACCNSSLPNIDSPLWGC